MVLDEKSKVTDGFDSLPLKCGGCDADVIEENWTRGLPSTGLSQLLRNLIRYECIHCNHQMYSGFCDELN